MQWRRAAVLLLSLAAVTTFAQTPHTITPDSGPVSGGQEVLVTGDFGLWPYGLIFGSVGVPATRVDEHTLRAITPPHPPGTVTVTIFEYDIGISTDLTYTYEGDAAAAFDRVLLPILLPPIAGRNGSEFRTDFRAYNRSEQPVLIHGLFGDCGAIPCPDNHDDRGIYIAPLYEYGDQAKFWMSGTPGAFVYVPRSQMNDLSMQLRAYDVSREATNFGTEIPVVHADEMRPDEITFVGIPTDPRFRNTLRIYSTAQQPMHVTIEGPGGLLVDQVVHLSTPADQFDPAYAAFVDFPDSPGPVRVRIWSALPEIVNPPVTVPDFWAFITVTNNDTQHITVISPQR